ncbi:SIS domain-containing protein [Parvularcula sp. LCG005]|uniref:SIS domain-containing protein n=1 Tax=Parvularcula sp. LCG005 TaxID=3078805 RepID=UPI00294250CB|nr:SIS domain-containing protein [Parvularcula sp. LCG005]WOI53653.1 SIS domain-containing protein [Parvularcula sp. LCG005]
MMAPESTRMFAEAAEAPAVVQRLLDQFPDRQDLLRVLNKQPINSVVTCGRGSSDHAATYGKYLFEILLGLPTSSAALSVTSLYDCPPHAQGSACISISQSGRSPDLIAAARARRDAGAISIVLMNDPDGPLGQYSDLLLPLRAGREVSVAATKSYIASLVALAQLVALWSEDEALLSGLSELPQLLERAWSLEWQYAEDTLVDARNLFVIGRGYGLGIAQEAALKLKETCGLHAEAFSSAEVRHGPMAIVGEGFPVLGFAGSDRAGDDVRAVMAEFAQRGARTLLIDTSTDDHLPMIAAHPALEPILMIHRFYRFANSLSVRRGFDPDTPPHLNKVTKTQ